MSWIIDMVLGLLTSCLGISLPGLINMTAVKVAIERKRRAAWRFCWGACITIFLQAWLAIAFARYLSRHTELVDVLKGAGVFYFSGVECGILGSGTSFKSSYATT